MKTSKLRTIVPLQVTGTEKNIEHTATTATTAAAIQLYNACRQRLLDVNHWDKIAQGMSAGFRLVDKAGHEIQKTAEAGHYIRINLPAPGSSAGEGYDWVLIEVIEETGGPDEAIQCIAMRVRPSNHPLQPADDVAHFLDGSATSSFLVERREHQVIAGIYGRNEKPNTSTAGVGDKLRNTVVAIGAIAGMANLQWNALAKGIVEGEP